MLQEIAYCSHFWNPNGLWKAKAKQNCQWMAQNFSHIIFIYWVVCRIFKSYKEKSRLQISFVDRQRSKPFWLFKRSSLKCYSDKWQNWRLRLSNHHLAGDDKEGRAVPKTEKVCKIDREGPPQILKLRRLRRHILARLGASQARKCEGFLWAVRSLMCHFHKNSRILSGAWVQTGSWIKLNHGNSRANLELIYKNKSGNQRLVSKVSFISFIKSFDGHLSH